MRAAAACSHASGGNAMRNRTSGSVTARCRTRGGVAHASASASAARRHPSTARATQMATPANSVANAPTVNRRRASDVRTTSGAP